MARQSMYFTLQLIDKDDLARGGIIKNMVEEKLEQGKANTATNDVRDNDLLVLVTGTGNDEIRRQTFCTCCGKRRNGITLRTQWGYRNKQEGSHCMCTWR